MIWFVCFFAALIVLAAGVVATAVFSRSESRVLTMLSPMHVLFGCVMVSSLLIFLPIYIHICADQNLHVWEALLLSLHNVFRLFVIDGEMEFVMDNLTDIPSGLYTPYFFLSAVLFLMAPLLTVGFVLSFFKNLTAHLRLLVCVHVPLFVFSEMNARSLTLARDIQKHNPKSRIVFADVFDQDDETSYEMIIAAKKMRSICFKEDIADLPLGQHRKNSRICVFILGADESENLVQAVRMEEKYGDYPNLEMYVFCEQVESEMLLSGGSTGRALLRRINVTQSFIQYNLYTDGIRLFEQAIPDGEIKHISVVIVGLGAFGTELLRTLAWFCQMDGYRLEIHAFDADPLAQDRFELLCPELIDPAHNGNFTDDGDAQYRITIHGGVSADCRTLYKAIGGIENISAVYVALNSDSENINVSAGLRTCFEQRDIHPSIHAVVESSEKKDAVQGAVNYSGQPFDIDFIGDLRSVYTQDVLLRSELENVALQRHLRWGKESAFWQFEYNHKSSVASAIHARMKRLCGMPGIDLLPSERTPEQRERLRKLEHRRWNAYMRSEGYIYSGSPEKSSRNNLGKMHHCLVTYDLLSEEERQKDDD